MAKWGWGAYFSFPHFCLHIFPLETFHLKHTLFFSIKKKQQHHPQAKTEVVSAGGRVGGRGGGVPPGFQPSLAVGPTGAFVLGVVTAEVGAASPQPPGRCRGEGPASGGQKKRWVPSAGRVLLIHRIRRRGGVPVVAGIKYGQLARTAVGLHPPLPPSLCLWGVLGLLWCSDRVTTRWARGEAGQCGGGGWGWVGVRASWESGAGVKGTPHTN